MTEAICLAKRCVILIALPSRNSLIDTEPDSPVVRVNPLMFSTLGLWYEIFHPWHRECNTDGSDCRVFWRRSRTAYMNEDEPLSNFLVSIGAWKKSQAVDANATPAPVEAVPATSSA
eukprot:766544-Hanusia_phi.AAC.6